MTPFEISIDRMIEKYRKMGYAQPDPPPWLRMLLHRLRFAIPAKHAAEVLAVTGVQAVHDMYGGRLNVHVRMLLQRGWGVNMSMFMYKNFRMCHPTNYGYEVENLALLTRGQLIAQFGPSFGAVLADMFADPDSQPVFCALFMGKLDELVVRPALHVATVIEVGDDVTGDTVMRADLGPLRLLDASEPGQMPGGEPKTLTYTTAFQIYRDATGLEPDFTFDINPRELDYEALAAAEEVQQANCPE